MDSTRPSSPWQSEAAPPPVQPLEMDGVELNRLSRYGLLIGLMALCALLSTWSRIDFRETAVALDDAQRRYAEAMADRERLELEMASLTDPVWLSKAAANLSLEQAPEIIEIPAGAAPAAPAPSAAAPSPASEP